MPGTVWLKNFVGFSLSDEDLADVPYPRLEMTATFALKAAQIGAVCGIGVGGPVMCFRDTPEPAQITLKRVAKFSARYGRYGVLLGLVVSPLLAVNNAWGKSLPMARLECYKLRKDHYMRRTNRSSVAGAAVGCGLVGKALPWLQVAGPSGAAFGLAAGLIAGDLYHVVKGEEQYGLQYLLKETDIMYKLYHS